MGGLEDTKTGHKRNTPQNQRCARETAQRRQTQSEKRPRKWRGRKPQRLKRRSTTATLGTAPTRVRDYNGWKRGETTIPTLTNEDAANARNSGDISAISKTGTHQQGAKREAVATPTVTLKHTTLDPPEVTSTPVQEIKAPPPSVPEEIKDIDFAPLEERTLERLSYGPTVLGPRFYRENLITLSGCTQTTSR